MTLYVIYCELLTSTALLKRVKFNIFGVIREKKALHNYIEEFLCLGFDGIILFQTSSWPSKTDMDIRIEKPNGDLNNYPQYQVSAQCAMVQYQARVQCVNPSEKCQQGQGEPLSLLSSTAPPHINLCNPSPP